MITNSTSIGSGGVPSPDPRRGRAASSSAAAPAGGDTLSTKRATELRAALASTPEIRPDVVARAEALAVDPNYPPLKIIERVASLIAASQDLSETED